LAERYRQFAELPTRAGRDKGLNALSEFCGMSHGTLASLAAKNTSPEDCNGAISTFKALHEATGVRLHWLFYGRGGTGELQFRPLPPRFGEDQRRPARKTLPPGRAKRVS